MTETDRLLRTESLFFTENAAIFAERLEGGVARDVQVDIKTAAHIHDNDAEEIDSLDVRQIVVVEGKDVRKFSTEHLATGLVIIETVVPTWMPVQKLPAQRFAPRRRIRRGRGLMYNSRDGHGRSNSFGPLPGPSRQILFFSGGSSAAPGLGCCAPSQR